MVKQRELPPRRELAVAVLVCAAGALLALVAAGRPWLVEVVARPAPLTDERIARTGGDLMPWLPALGWVALAGAGALLATRGWIRRTTGWSLVFAGSGVLGAVALSTARPGAGLGWAAVCGLGGVAVAGAGAWAAVRGHRWPAMGARYERDARRSPAARPGSQSPPGRAGAGEIRPEQMWQALDRGEDPTA